MTETFRCTDAIKKSLTKEETAAMARIGKVAKKANAFAAYARGGEINCAGFNDLALFYKETAADGKIVPNYLPLPASDTDLKKLWDVSTPSPHGQGKKLVHDETYRQAREFKTDSFTLTYDPLPSIIEDVSKMQNSDNTILLAKMAKLNIYGKDGFFKAHRDTPRGDKHVGSIVVCLPGTFTGGELLVRREGREEKFAWEGICSQGNIGWAFLYSDCDHEVLPVTSGYRLTVAYDVFVSTAVLEGEAHVSATDMYRDLRLMRDSIKQTRTLAFDLQHMYASQGKIEPSTLKGVDSIIYKAAVALGLNCKIGFIGDLDDEDDEDEEDDEYDDEDEEKREELLEDIKNNTFMVGDHMDLGLDDTYYDGEDGCLKDMIEAETYRDLIWVTDEKDSISFVGGHYVSYGNQPSLSCVYVSGAIIVTLPGSDAVKVAEDRAALQPKKRARWCF